MTRTLRYGSPHTPIAHDRHVTRRRTNQSFDQLMAMDDAARHLGISDARAPFGKRAVAPTLNTSHAEAMCREHIIKLEAAEMAQRRHNFLFD